MIGELLIEKMVKTFHQFPWTWEYTDGLNTARSARATMADAKKLVKDELVEAFLEEGYVRYNPIKGTHRQDRDKSVWVREAWTRLLAPPLALPGPVESKPAVQPAKPELIAGLRPLLAHLNMRDQQRFCELALQPHPITGKPRQSQVMLAEAKALGVTHRTFRIAAASYMLGLPEFSRVAVDWFDGSYELVGLFMTACKNAGWVVRTHWTDPGMVAKGYIWVAKR